MLNSFKSELITKLNDAGLNVSTYRGEFIDPNNMELVENILPNVFIDFVGDEPWEKNLRNYKFHIYVAHVSYLSPENNEFAEVYEVMQEIDEVLHKKVIAGSNPVQTGKSKKLLDSVTTNGYMTVFTKELSVVFI